jgi:adenine-specific DNA-methyltransferase
MARSPRSRPAPVMDAPSRADSYVHVEDTVARPEIGAAPRFRGKKDPVTYRYDSSLAPALDWDTCPARETGALLLS